MAVVKKQIISVMLYHLNNLNTSGLPVVAQSVIADHISNVQVAGTSAQTLFKNLIDRTVVLNGGKQGKWPDSWPDKTVEDLADAILAFFTPAPAAKKATDKSGETP